MHVLAANISAPEFIGPLYNDTEMDVYFICHIIYTDGVEVTFDVALFFDSELGRAIQTVSSAVSFDAAFTQQDFAAYYGKSVIQLLSVWLEIV